MSKNQNKDNHSAIDWRWVATGLLVCFLLLVIHLLHKGTSFESLLYELAKEIGFAILVAIILVVTIERVTRARHGEVIQQLTQINIDVVSQLTTINNTAVNQLLTDSKNQTKSAIQAIQKDLYEAIFERSVPKKILAELHASILEKSIFRKNLEIVGTLVKKQDLDGKDYAEFSFTWKFELINESPSVFTYTLPCYIENPVLDLNTQAELKYIKIDALVQPLAAIDADGNIKMDHPIEFQPGEKHLVEISAVIPKSWYDTELWTSQTPTSGLRVRVEIPNKDFQVWSACKSSNSLQYKNSEESTPVSKSWSSDSGLLAGQGIAIWWKPLDKTTIAYR